jgi:hypothetical protein
VFLTHVTRPGDRTVPLAHALTALAMAGMFSPWGDPVPPGPGAVLFGSAAAWFAVRAVRGSAPPHVAVATAAMALMYLGTSAGGHAGHGSGGLLAVVVALAAAGYFGWHAWVSAERARPAGPRTEPAAHVVMSGLMAVMFLTAV